MFLLDISVSCESVSGTVIPVLRSRTEARCPLHPHAARGDGKG